MYVGVDGQKEKLRMKRVEEKTGSERVCMGSGKEVGVGLWDIQGSCIVSERHGRQVGCVQIEDVRRFQQGAPHDYSSPTQV